MKTLFVALVSATLAMPVAAQDRPKKEVDPNRVICRSEEVLGSHLQTTRRCMTAAQWIEFNREQRENVSHAQSGSPRL